MEKKETSDRDQWLALERERDEDERAAVSRGHDGLALRVVAKVPGEGSEKTQSPLDADARIRSRPRILTQVLIVLHCRNLD